VEERLGATPILADVVGGPTGTEVLASHGELADEVGEVGIVGVPAGLGAEVADARIGDPLPIPVERSGLLVEEDESTRFTGRSGSAKASE
jgi:hypothetical protein